ncbi:MAG: dynamin family protein [Oscillospiraceae bacterium]
MSYINESKAYENKLIRQIDCISEILAMETCDVIDNATRESLSDLKEKASRLLNKLQKNEFEIAIVGLEKAGKSTTANAMMGYDILPSEEKRCTYTTTSICSGDDTAEIVFFSTEEFDKKFVGNLRRMGINNADGYSFAATSLDTYSNLFNALDPEKKEFFSSTINREVEDMLTNKSDLLKWINHTPIVMGGASELESIEFKKFIRAPECAVAVKKITIKTSKLGEGLKNATIYDVPGFDSPTQMHKEQTIEKMKIADAIVLIVSARAPSFTGPLVDIFQRESDDDGISLSEKTFLFANYADIAGELRKNIGIIKDELQRYRIMNPRYFDNRVMPGSAKAKLQKDGKVTGTDAVDGIHKNGISDGIEDLLARLSDYNANERFEVLKTRINKIQADITNLLKNIFEANDVSPSDSLMIRSGEINAELSDMAKKRIEESLNAYRAELRSEFNKPNLPLTNKLVEEVIGEISSEKLGVIDTELRKAIEKSPLVSKTDIPYAVNKTLRDDKFSLIRNVFSHGVVDMAIDKHSQCDEEIVARILNGLGVNTNNDNDPTYIEIRKNVIAYINEHRELNDNRGYYKSLVERFSVDVIEILILLPYGEMSRWNKFNDDILNFHSLAMFDKNADMASTPDKQPLNYLLLYHDERKSEAIKYVAEAVKMTAEIIGSVILPPEIEKMLKKIVSAKMEKAPEYISKLLDRIDKSKDSDAKKDIVIGRLDDALEKIQVDDDDEITAESYEKAFNGKRNKTSEDVMNEINKDIDILNRVLREVVVNAIAIEKPFLALECQIIDNIVRSLGEKEFGIFIARNAHLIASEQYTSLKHEERRRIAQTTIVEKLKATLNAMTEIKE